VLAGDVALVAGELVEFDVGGGVLAADFGLVAGVPAVWDVGGVVLAADVGRVVLSGLGAVAALVDCGVEFLAADATRELRVVPPTSRPITAVRPPRKTANIPTIPAAAPPLRSVRRARS